MRRFLSPSAALEFERGAGAKTSAEVAEALSRLAELHELMGDWGRALARRKEALSARKRVDGKDHWRTADARLMLAFAEKVAGLGQAGRAKVEGALRKEQEAAQLEVQGKFAESERVALEALETYRALIGPESAEVARAWHRIGRCRVGTARRRRSQGGQRAGSDDTPEGAAGNPPGPRTQPQQPGAGGEQLGQHAAHGNSWRKPCGYGGLRWSPQARSRPWG